MTPSILAVVVLYKTSLQESQTVLSLRNAVRCLAPKEFRFKAIFIDNSPTTQRSAEDSESEIYLSFPGNPGLAYAYNFALQIARREGFDWLLTLDQDTNLPKDFLRKMGEVLVDVMPDPMIGTVVPQLCDGSKIISPYRYRWGISPDWFPAGFRGVPEAAVFALNSGSILRVSALLQAGGYDPAFWLDASDHAIFARLATLGKRTYIAGDLKVQHRLSILDSAAPPSLERANNTLNAESAFHDLWLGRPAGLVRNGVLLRRGLRSLGRGHIGVARLTLSHLLWRLTRSRKRRLRSWSTRSAEKAGNSVEQAAPKPGMCPLPADLGATMPRVKVSVCMALYNAGSFIDEQIHSVLPQLSPNDELIVVDDASQDGTPARIKAIGDPRIRLIVQQKNQGVVRTFEHAVRAATGDILFLCDGDDVWAKNKVCRVLQAFRNPAASLVATGIALIDEHGRPILNSTYMHKREFSDFVVANLVRNRFQGSAMAIRASLLEQVLPFPNGKMFLHDSWIGMVNRISGGEAEYVPEPLLLYRRHSNNLSKPMTLRKRALARLQLAAALICHLVKRQVFGPPNQRTRDTCRIFSSTLGVSITETG